MELIVIRHGETQANAEGRYQGALDIGLNQDGARHICWLADEIATTLAPFDRLLASPLLRTRESAAIFSRQLGLPVELAPAFRERHVGLFEGLTQAEAKARYPELWVRNITRRWAEAPLGGETLDEVIARVSQGLTALASTMQGERVLLVAHGVVAKVIRALTTAGFDDLFAWQLPNGGMLVVNLDSSISPLRFNRPVGQS
ncbi:MULTISPECIES: histidine phosphatase family protein [Aeromonas]|uniref:histidine phosphatase family protein n=1 Tax=Aeromonas TaxID=642 RepID=UPI00191E5294|nr:MULTISPECIES: histidine phosphatase family protein [Aeromonas]MBL0472979.1 histidine phosphatase family protein [Aeromonas veronii]QWZ82423.1 histidine phosphatase family protein [Aeromonas sp. FDAARGOS 1414]